MKVHYQSQTVINQAYTTHVLRTYEIEAPQVTLGLIINETYRLNPPPSLNTDLKNKPNNPIDYKPEQEQRVA